MSRRPIADFRFEFGNRQSKFIPKGIANLKKELELQADDVGVGPAICAFVFFQHVKNAALYILSQCVSKSRRQSVLIDVILREVYKELFGYKAVNYIL